MWDCSLTQLDLTGLHFAAAIGHLPILKSFLSHGAEINSADVVRALLPSQHRRTPLHFAASNGHLEVVCTLLETPEVEINAATIGNETALHKAVQFSRSDCVTALLKSGADPFIRNKVGS